MHRGREAEKSMFWHEKQLRTSLRRLQSMTVNPEARANSKQLFSQQQGVPEAQGQQI